MKEVFTAIGHGDLRLSVFAVVPQIHATHYWASKHPEGHAEEALMDEETAGALILLSTVNHVYLLTEFDCLAEGNVTN